MPETPIEQGRDTPQRFCADFADELSSRGVSVRDAADRSGWSKSAIGNARTGPRLPRRELVADVLSAIGLTEAQVQDWTLRHAALSMTGADPAASDPAAPPPAPPRRRPGLPVAAGVAALVGAVLAGSIVYLLVRPATAPPSAVASAVVTVQNKVALGAEDLVEDTTPAYLSSRPEPFCGRTGCKVEGTEVVSGALLPAVCTVTGAEMWNYNLDSPADDNPGRARSALWYRLTWPDGRAGYLSEVYLEPASRGGLGLPTCTAP
ncbi:helix-turn-helix domain-containing protein [Pseudonocardia pini]|uniref:helix-turn-helix domain-containing protein n=1 Tax=Pseudonocardia pini TaxID=2758030 RepID=UPI0015EFF942|nr:helix-turn-helix transcriptional regulator [Pseudonocardia pini]